MKPKTAAGQRLLALTEKHQTAVVQLANSFQPDIPVERVDFSPLILDIEHEAVALERERIRTAVDDQFPEVWEEIAPSDIRAILDAERVVDSAQ